MAIRRDPDQKHDIRRTARGRRGCERAYEYGIALRAQGHGRRVEHAGLPPVPDGLQTRVPSTAETAPVVPIAFPPARTSPLTLTSTRLLTRSTLAWPPSVDQGSPPPTMPPTVLADVPGVAPMKKVLTIVDQWTP